MDQPYDRDEETTNTPHRHVQDLNAFPRERSFQAVRKPQPKNLGTTPLAEQLALTDEQTNGHWCSRCEGIWFGYTLEAECPVCRNRHG